eukprot:gb/GFBE01065928.1/.p1 GENE.gb/GFBE01065928.1/~~gb/GFBE01065928.1/.p1  ORF type:complete len:260 (+),score=29.00 gb/GFBE01065928.1/:1-780(+)
MASLSPSAKAASAIAAGAVAAWLVWHAREKRHRAVHRSASCLPNSPATPRPARACSSAEEAASITESSQAELVLDNLGHVIMAFLTPVDAWRMRPVGRLVCRLAVGQSNRLDHPAGCEAEAVFAVLDSRTAMSAATIFDVFERVLASPEILEAHDASGQTPLMRAVQRGSTRLVAALLTARAKPNAKGAAGLTALHVAAVGRSSEMCQLLLTHRADADVTSEDGYTALFYANCAGGEASVVKLLEGATTATGELLHQCI